MSLSSTSTIKGQLQVALGAKSKAYFDALSQFVSAKISRTEFEDVVRHALDAPQLGTCSKQLLPPMCHANHPCSPAAQFTHHLPVRLYCTPTPTHTPAGCTQTPTPQAQENTAVSGPRRHRRNTAIDEIEAMDGLPRPAGTRAHPKPAVYRSRAPPSAQVHR